MHRGRGRELALDTNSLPIGADPVIFSKGGGGGGGGGGEDPTTKIAL